MEQFFIVNVMFWHQHAEEGGFKDFPRKSIIRASRDDFQLFSILERMKPFEDKEKCYERFEKALSLHRAIRVVEMQAIEMKAKKQVWAE